MSKKTLFLSKDVFTRTKAQIENVGNLCKTFSMILPLFDICCSNFDRKAPFRNL